MIGINEILLLWVYLLAVLLWFIIVSFWGRKTFSVGRYAFFIIPPIAGLFILQVVTGINFITFFLASAVGGWTTEIALGWVTKKTFGMPTWEYRSLPIFGNHVSPVTLPYWGIAGILFLTIYKTMGLFAG
jgi:hypothetical protein